MRVYTNMPRRIRLPATRGVRYVPHARGLSTPPSGRASAHLRGKETMFSLDVSGWSIVLGTGIVYGALLLGLRLAGKRELGQMTPFDLVVILLIANTVQTAMVGPEPAERG